MTKLGVLSAVAVLLALAFGGLYGLLVVVALIGAWWVVWLSSVAFAAHRNERKQERHRQLTELQHAQPQITPQERAERAKQATRQVWFVGLLVLGFCWWAYDRDGQTGLLIAASMSVVIVCGIAFVASILDGLRRRTARRKTQQQEEREVTAEAEMVSSLEAAGVPNPVAAIEAFSKWHNAFSTKFGREPKDTEVDHWKVRWQELHGAPHINSSVR